MKTIESALGILGMTSALAVQVLAQPLDNFTYTTNDNAITITAFTNWQYSYTVTIPRRINGLPVIRIDSDAFYGCNMTGVVIPNGITSVGDYAFQYCATLTSIAIPDSVTNIGDYAFDCYSIPVPPFGTPYFSSLTNLTIGTGVTDIGTNAFYGCTNLGGILFEGSPPTIAGSIDFSVQWWATPEPVLCFLNVYYLPGTTGWGPTFAGSPALPWNPTPRSASVHGEQFSFDIIGTTNIPIALEASTNLAAGPWVPLQTCTLTNGLLHFTDPDFTNHPSRFYRFRYWSGPPVSVVQ
jgi:hypothetical protein